MSEQLMIPVLPLRDAVLFPGIALPIGAGRPSTLRAIEAALRAPEPLVLAVAQRQNVDDVTPEGLYSVGTIARLGQVQRSLSGMQLVLHGERRGVALRYQERDGYYIATAITAADQNPADPGNAAFVALFRETRERSIELAKRAGRLGQERIAAAHRCNRIRIRAGQIGKKRAEIIEGKASGHEGSPVSGKAGALSL